jgi:hypothetical protein
MNPVETQKNLAPNTIDHMLGNFNIDKTESESEF